jgi:hypothetical protein
MTWTFGLELPVASRGQRRRTLYREGGTSVGRDLLRQVVGLCLARVVARGVALVGPQERVADRELHVGHRFVTQVDEVPAHAGRVATDLSHLDHAGAAGLVAQGGSDDAGAGQKQRLETVGIKNPSARMVDFPLWRPCQRVVVPCRGRAGIHRV